MLTADSVKRLTAYLDDRAADLATLERCADRLTRATFASDRMVGSTVLAEMAYAAHERARAVRYRLAGRISEALSCEHASLHALLAAWVTLAADASD